MIIVDTLNEFEGMGRHIPENLNWKREDCDYRMQYQLELKIGSVPQSSAIWLFEIPDHASLTFWIYSWYIGTRSAISLSQPIGGQQDLAEWLSEPKVGSNPWAFSINCRRLIIAICGLVSACKMVPSLLWHVLIRLVHQFFRASGSQLLDRMSPSSDAVKLLYSGPVNLYIRGSDAPCFIKSRNDRFR